MEGVVELDPEEDYVIMPLSVLERLLRDASVVCQDHCPSGRDPGTCPYLFSLSRSLGLGSPPCASDYGDYRPEYFREMLKEIEKKYRAPAMEILRTLRTRGPRSLEENIDFMETTFYVGVLKELGARKRIYLAKGSEIKIHSAKVL